MFNFCAAIIMPARKMSDAISRPLFSAVILIPDLLEKKITREVREIDNAIEVVVRSIILSDSFIKNTKLQMNPGKKITNTNPKTMRNDWINGSLILSKRAIAVKTPKTVIPFNRIFFIIFIYRESISFSLSFV